MDFWYCGCAFNLQTYSSCLIKVAMGKKNSFTVLNKCFCSKRNATQSCCTTECLSFSIQCVFKLFTYFVQFWGWFMMPPLNFFCWTFYFLGLFTFIHTQNTRPKMKLLIDFWIDQVPSVNATLFRLVRSIWQEAVAIASEPTSFFFYLIARLMISRLPPTHEEVTSNWISFLPLCEQHR